MPQPRPQAKHTPTPAQLPASANRQLFDAPRAAEYFDVRSLQTMTGRQEEEFGDVVVKELLDNALDAGETAGRAPIVNLAVARDTGSMKITVTDNGDGMPANLVKRVLDFSVLVSDKAAYRSPTRGQQGNALKTVIGITSAMGSAEPLIIESRGLRHTIKAGLDPAGHPRVDHQRAGVAKHPGTSISVTLPAGELDLEHWLAGFALVNPHATLINQGSSGDPEEVVSYKPTVAEGWRKPMPGDPTSAHHYDAEALAGLVFSYLHASHDMPLGAFVRTFDGLTSTIKAKQVAAAVPEIARLSDFKDHPGAVSTLLEAMQSASRAPKVKALGQVDEAHYRGCFRDWYGETNLWGFKRGNSVEDGMPYVLEVAFSATEKPGRLFYAVNYSVSFDDPLTRLPLSAGAISTTGAASFLRHIGAFPDGESLRAAAVHVIAPAASFLDKGKSALAVGR
jgi:DNA topoisomerase VI subunit B